MDPHVPPITSSVHPAPARQAQDPVGPYLDDGGLLRVGRHWVAIPETQLTVVQLLLDRREAVVRTEEVARAYADAGGSGRPTAVRTMLGRLARRVGEVGLRLVTVRKRGVLLTWPAGTTGAGAWALAR